MSAPLLHRSSNLYLAPRTWFANERCCVDYVQIIELETKIYRSLSLSPPPQFYEKFIKFTPCMKYDFTLKKYTWVKMENGTSCSLRFYSRDKKRRERYERVWKKKRVWREKEPPVIAVRSSELSIFTSKQASGRGRTKTRSLLDVVASATPERWLIL